MSLLVLTILNLILSHVVFPQDPNTQIIPTNNFLVSFNNGFPTAFVYRNPLLGYRRIPKCVAQLCSNLKLFRAQAHGNVSCFTYFRRKMRDVAFIALPLCLFIMATDLAVQFKLLLT